MTSLQLHKQNESEEIQLQESQSEQQQQTFTKQSKQNSQEQESLSTKTIVVQVDSSVSQNLEDLPIIKKQQNTQENQILEQSIIVEKLDNPQLQTLNQNMIQEKESQQIIGKDNVHSPNQQENQEQAHKDEKDFQQNSQDLESQSQSIQKNNSLNEKTNKRRNVIILSVIFAGLLVIALSLYFALKPGEENDNSSAEKSPYVIQRKFVTSKQQNYRLELLTTHNHKRNDSSNYTREIVIEYLFSMLIQNQTDDQIQILAFVDQTKQYEVGKQDDVVILPGARNFIDLNDSNNLTQTPNQKNSTENQSTNQSPNINSTSDQDQEFPFSDDDIQLSRAEIIQFNVTKGGVIKDIAFPINVNETFLFSLPAFLTTLLPNLQKSNYDIIDPKGVKNVTKQANFTQKNVHGTYKMSVMQSHKSATGDVTLVQQFTQKTNDDYKQVTQQQSNITFNNQGYLVKGRVESAYKIISFLSKDNSTEDVLKNQKITQKFNVTFINETNISNNEKTHINNVFNMMSTVQYNWTYYLEFIENLKKTDIQLDSTIITSNQTEKPLVDLNQKVNISSPSTRMLTQNNNLLDNLQVKLFEKDILTIKMRSFISFKCDKQQDSSSNDQCQTQVFLQFLGLNIPVSPIQKVKFPLTKFKNEVNWLKKNLLLAVSKIKNNVIDVVKQVKSQIDAKFNLTQNLFSNLSNPILNDVQKYASVITSSISVNLLDKLQKLQLQYTQILNSTQQKLGAIQNITSQVAQVYISTLQNNLPKIQQSLIEQSQKINQIYQNKTNLIYKDGQIAIQKVQQTLKQAYDLIQDKINIQIQQNLTKFVQSQQIKENPQIKSVLELKTSQNILNQINENQKAAQDLYNSFNSLTSLDSLYTLIASNFTSCADSINQDITTKLANITDIFSNIAQQSMLSFKDTITTLKNKTYDFSSNLTQQIQDGVDNLFSTVISYDKKIMDQSEQALQMLSADFSQSNFIDQVKKQMGKQSQILTDDISDLSLKSLNLTNLQDGNIFDFPVNSYINGIKDAINNGTDTIKNTINSVKNVQNSFNDLSNQLSQIHQVALNFSQFENQFLNINKNFEDIVGQIDLQNLFQTITEDLKQDLINFVKSQILEKIQKQAIDQIKDKFQNLGNELLKTNLKNAIAKLENVNKLFESAITKISSKFQIKKEQKVLFDEKMKFPQYPQPYYIPTPIGIPLVLQYYFQFSAQIFTFIDIQATSINAGFGVSANAEFDASAALSVLIAEIGAYAQGTLVSVDLQGLLSIQLLQKQNLQFIVDATFKAFNLKASIYISYIKIKLKKVCLFQRRMLGWGFGSIFSGISRIGRAISKLGQQAGHFVKRVAKFVKKYACIYVPQISKSDKIDILPALNIKGSQTQVQLVNINVG
ncbi:transmembrane protein, putative (macronuclear) [Tetrahymena thermophila SB210]|uniref:Transmembrane protein, putative n=1 Tax=Tetrahymena thermophila (strain SB210) TaxID=312017 RepID=Q23FE6_TETTS|nr:transmembrane protein, putative [Tetrahymena thermophila SB210]EAR95207.2 transmembrane protein, putative [Tetrahymena thermophila SB210]|eukprot:XP_001015452.2 transmembrane protein, putative [Tetrahymena thermophila SB210]